MLKIVFNRSLVRVFGSGKGDLGRNGAKNDREGAVRCDSYLKSKIIFFNVRR